MTDLTAISRAWVAGLAIAAAMHPEGSGWLAWVAWVPLLPSLQQLRPGLAIAAGVVCGVTAHLAGCLWVWHTIGRLQQLTPLAALPWFVLFALAQALPVVAFTTSVSLLRYVALPWVTWTVLVALLWLATEAWLPRIVAWRLGDAFAADATLRWILLPIGRSGASALCILTAASLAYCLPGHWVQRLSGAIGVLACVCLMRLPDHTTPSAVAHAMPIRDGLSVVLVQMALPPDGPIAADPRLSWRRHVAATRAALRHQPLPDLIVWPETVLRLSPRHTPRWRRRIEAAARHWRVPLLFGALDRSADGERERNAAYLVHPRPRSGHWQVTHKRALMPFGEHLPLPNWPTPWRGWRTTGAFEAGTQQPLLHWATRHGPLRLGIGICFEAVSTPILRDHAAQGADVLVQLADDGWLGRTGSAQHLALLRLQAALAKRWTIRASNSGPSALIDPTGELAGSLPFGRAGALKVVLPPA